MNSTTLEHRRPSRFGSLLRRFSPMGRRRVAAPVCESAPTPAVTPLGKTVLIVDDDAVVRMATAAKLESQGYSVLNASDASSAISTARKEQPDVILLDLTFPPDVGAVAWDGYRIMNWLKRLEEARDIPVIVITADDPAHCRERSLAEGAVALLPKPIEAENLLAAVRHHTQGQRAVRRKPAAAAEFQI